MSNTIISQTEDARTVGARANLNPKAAGSGGPGIVLRHLREIAGLSPRELATGMGFRGGRGHRLIDRVENGELVPAPTWFGAAAEVCATALATRHLSTAP